MKICGIANGLGALQEFYTRSENRDSISNELILLDIMRIGYKINYIKEPLEEWYKEDGLTTFVWNKQNIIVGAFWNGNKTEFLLGNF
jgi:hypothetical protein